MRFLQGLQWSFGHSDSLDGLGLSMSLEQHDAAHHPAIHPTPIRTGGAPTGLQASVGTGSWGPLPNSLMEKDVGELSLSLSFTGMSLDESHRSRGSHVNLEVIGHSAQIRPMDLTAPGTMEPPPPGGMGAFLSPSEVPVSPRDESKGDESKGGEGKAEPRSQGSSSASGGVSPTVNQLSQVGQSYRAGQITAAEKGAMKAAILGSHQGATVVSRQAAGVDGGDLLSPTAQQLHKLNQFFKGGHITKAQKDELKMHILEASTDSL